MAETKKLKINDRVKRANGTSGAYGVVREIKQEVTAARTNSSEKEKERSLMVCVQWDNGTQSYFAPDALEVVQG